MEYILTITRAYDDYEVTLREEGNGHEEHDYFRSKSEEAVVKFINKVTEEYGFEYHNLYPNDYMLEYLRNFSGDSNQEWNIYSR
jgi:hypothetical protein